VLQNQSSKSSASTSAAAEKIEARLRYVDDKSIMVLAEVLKAPLQELFHQERPTSGSPPSWLSSIRRASE